MNLGSLFSRHARYRPDHLAVVFEDQRLTWLEFNKQINRLANALVNLGIQKGDKVTTILPNCLELLEIYWAIAKIGAVVVPASTLLLEKAMKTLLQDSDSVALSIIIPAKNEAAVIGEVVSTAREAHPDAEIIVVNDGSTDATAEVAEQAGATVLSHPESLGNGAAVKAGARAARGEILAFMDGDGQHDPRALSRLLAKLDEGYKMVVGARDSGSRES